MKQLLALLMSAAFAVTAVAADKPVQKPAVEKKAEKKPVKKHKKAEGTKIPDAPKKK